MIFFRLILFENQFTLTDIFNNVSPNKIISFIKRVGLYCCCLPSETYGRNGATPIFRSFFTELPIPPQAAGVVGTFNVLDIYPSEHYDLSFFGPYGRHLFLQCLLFVVFFCCIHFHFASILCMCVMYLTSN